ncbi:MAG: hypothetical protein ABIJ80_02910 [Patescibacteria group bacterium]
MIDIVNFYFKKIFFVFVGVGLCLIVLVFFALQNTYASHVPVKDKDLIKLFKEYQKNFETYKKEINDPREGSIAGSNYLVSEIATANCKTFEEPAISNKGQGIYKYGWQDLGWQDLDPFWVAEQPFSHFGDINYSRRGNDDKPDEITGMDSYFFLPTSDELNNAEINASNSLRCLLQELVEWKKLDLNIQMHAMVKEHFSNAQTFMLNQQLLNTLAAATILGANQFGRMNVGPDGKPALVSTTGYVSNLGENIGDARQREIAGLYQEMLGEDGDTLTKLSLPEETKKYIAGEVKRNLEAKEETDFETLQVIFSVCENEPNNIVCTPVVASSIIEKYARERIGQAEQNRRQQLSMSGGYLSTEDCGEPGDLYYDPYCRNSVVTTPGDILGKNLDNALNTGINAMRSADAAGEGASTAAQNLSFNLEAGLKTIETGGLIANQQTLTELFNEFEFVLTDYYGIDEGTTNWARNALVNTWDDIMWGGGAGTKAMKLQNQLDAMIKTAQEQNPAFNITGVNGGNSTVSTTDIAKMFEGGAVTISEDGTTVGISKDGGVEVTIPADKNGVSATISKDGKATATISKDGVNVGISKDGGVTGTISKDGVSVGISKNGSTISGTGFSLTISKNGVVTANLADGVTEISKDGIHIKKWNDGSITAEITKDGVNVGISKDGTTKISGAEFSTTISKENGVEAEISGENFTVKTSKKNGVEATVSGKNFNVGLSEDGVSAEISKDGIKISTSEKGEIKATVGGKNFNVGLSEGKLNVGLSGENFNVGLSEDGVKLDLDF